MFLNSFRSFSPAYRLILKDRTCQFLVGIPIFLGALLYYYLGRSFYSFAIGYGNQYIGEYLSDGTFGDMIYILVVSILTIMMYFIVNWTFVLILSLISSPFNDLLSARVEKLLLNKKPSPLEHNAQGAISRAFSVLGNESKKIVFIIFFSTFSLALGYIPILTPLSLLVTALLFAAGYIDYSWSRHGVSFKNCRKEITKDFLSYGFGASFFMILVTIPFINIIVPSFATSYFTVLWVKNNKKYVECDNEYSH